MRVRTDIRPGDVGRVVELHGEVYAREFGLDATFEGYVAAGIGEFARSFDPARDRLWLAEDEENRAVGSIAIVGIDIQTAQLRWFVVAPEARGGGIGRKLLANAIEFCRERGFRSVFLWTISELTVAAHLYRSVGFRKTEEKIHHIWGAARSEEKYELHL